MDDIVEELKKNTRGYKQTIYIQSTYLIMNDIVEELKNTIRGYKLTICYADDAVIVTES